MAGLQGVLKRLQMAYNNTQRNFRGVAVWKDEKGTNRRSKEVESYENLSTPCGN